LDATPEDARVALVAGIAEHMAEPVVDYVRLNISARRAP
jgi:hypothetical protein